MFDSSIGRTLLGGFLAGIAGQDPNEIAQRKDLAKARAEEAKAQTAAIQADTEQKKAQQSTALEQLLALGTQSSGVSGTGGSGFLSAPARALVQRAGNAEDPFGDTSLLAAAPSALQSEALARLTSTAVGGPSGAASAISTSGPGDLTLGGFNRLSDIVGYSDQQREAERKRLFPTKLEQLTEQKNIEQQNVAIQKLGLAAGLLSAAREGHIDLTGLAQSRNVLLETAAQQLGIVESVRQLRGAMLDEYSVKVRLNQNLIEEARRVLREQDLVGKIPDTLVAKAISNPGALTDKERKALEPLGSALAAARTKTLATQVGALSDLPSQKVGRALLNTAIQNGDIETAQKMLGFLRTDAVNRLGPQAAQFYPEIQTEPKKFLGFIPHGAQISGLAAAPPTGLDSTEQAAYLLLSQTGGDPSAALDLAKQHFAAAAENGVSPAQRAAFQRLVKFLSDMKRSAGSDAASGGSE